MIKEFPSHSGLYKMYIVQFAIAKEPKERRLGGGFVSRLQKGQRRLVREWDYSYDIPLQKSLEQLLNNEAIYQQV